ncbi:MAG: hypothetical protein WDN44_07165 [Sphingomonas sp.]
MTVSNLTMRGIVNAPLFLRLGKRMRGPEGRAIGTMRRILIQNVTSSNANILPSVFAGLGGHPIEDVQVSDVFLHHAGGAAAAMAAVAPPEAELGYPEATMFGDLPATGFFLRHLRGAHDEQRRGRGRRARSAPGVLARGRRSRRFLPCAARPPARPSRSTTSPPFGWPQARAAETG